MLDGDLTFNLDEWETHIRSQELLFTFPALIRVSDILREDFHDGHGEGRRMPTMLQDEVVEPRLLQLLEATVGYDLPCLISAPNNDRGTIMFCAQDPLRGKGENGITVGTFFGVDDNRLRHSKRHYAVVWQLVRHYVASGYSVWLTDAYKLFISGRTLDPELMRLCIRVLEQEVATVQPVKIVAFGGRAKWALSGFCDSEKIAAVRHPAARYTRQWVTDGAKRGYGDTVEERVQARVDRYLRDIGQDVESCLTSR